MDTPDLTIKSDSIETKEEPIVIDDLLFPPSQNQDKGGLADNLSIENLNAEIVSLATNLQYSIEFVKEQQDEFEEIARDISNIEKRLKNAQNGDRKILIDKLITKIEQQKMLEATLAGQWKKIEEKKAQLTQYQSALAQQRSPVELLNQDNQDTSTTIIVSDDGATASAKKPLSKRWGKVALLFGTMSLMVLGGTTFYALRGEFSATSQSQIAASNESHQEALDIAALGYLEPAGEVIEVSAPAYLEGARVEKLLVNRGTKVKAGQTIAILDNQGRLQANLEQAKRQIDIAQARLEQVKAGAKTGEIKAQDAEFKRIQAELTGQISTQRSTIATLEAQLRGEQQTQNSTIERLRVELNNANRDCQRYETLLREGGVSEQERDRFCLVKETTEKSLNEAIANLNLSVSTRQEQIREAKANLNRTTTTLKKQATAEAATLEAVAKVRPVDVKIAQAELGAAIADQKRAQADLDLAYVKAPHQGQILRINTRPGELVGTQGIVELGQTERMYVSAEVYETDINRVQVGQAVTITSGGITETLKGTVEEVGLLIAGKDVLGTDPIADADARVVEVKILLDPNTNQAVANLTNLQVNVVIHATKN